MRRSESESRVESYWKERKVVGSTAQHQVGLAGLELELTQDPTTLQEGEEQLRASQQEEEKEEDDEMGEQRGGCGFLLPGPPRLHPQRSQHQVQDQGWQNIECSKMACGIYA